LIIDGRDDDVDVHVEYVIVLDDWLDGLGTTPEQELERIRDMGAAMGGPGHDMGDMEWPRHRCWVGMPAMPSIHSTL